jgi:hypothetical protein
MAFVVPYAMAEDSCLDHLGGGMSDVFCYIEQAKKLDGKSRSIYIGIKNTIPEGSSYRKRFERFLSERDPGEYCEIIRGLSSDWGRDRNPKMSTKVGDVEYYECLYNVSIWKLNKLKGMARNSAVDY